MVRNDSPLGERDDILNSNPEPYDCLSLGPIILNVQCHNL